MASVALTVGLCTVPAEGGAPHVQVAVSLELGPRRGAGEGGGGRRSRGGGGSRVVLANGGHNLVLNLKNNTE